MQRLKKFLFSKRFSIFKVSLSIFDVSLILGFIYYVLTNQSDDIYQYVALLLAVIIHEVMHGYVAFLLGDPTAKQMGRLSLNPLVHIDPVGSVLLPGALILSGATFFIGWAKPVPVQAHYFRKPHRDMMWVALAGPISNIVLMLLSLFIFNLVLWLNPTVSLFVISILKFCQASFIINAVLAIFNMIPIPPLDGSHVLRFFLPQSLRNLYEKFEPYGMLLILLLVMTDSFSWLLRGFMSPLLNWAFN